MKAMSLERKFQELHDQFFSELTHEGIISAEAILQALATLPADSKTGYDQSLQRIILTLEEAPSASSVLLHLKALFSFIDYPSLLNHLISRFGSDILKKEMSAYEQDIQIFIHEITVAELIQHWPGRQISNFATVKVKFDGNPQNITLQKLNEFRRRFSNKLGLSEFIFTLIGCEHSTSFTALWAVHSFIIQVVTEYICQIIDEFFQREGVLTLHVDGALLYQSKVS